MALEVAAKLAGVRASGCGAGGACGETTAWRERERNGEWADAAGVGKRERGACEEALIIIIII